MNKAYLSGTVKSVHITEQATALVEIEYGPSREATGGRCEFVNAAAVRIPAQLLRRLSGVALAPGAWVEVSARLQGKIDNHSGRKSVELVAEHVTLLGAIAHVATETVGVAGR